MPKNELQNVLKNLQKCVESGYEVAKSRTFLVATLGVLHSFLEVLLRPHCLRPFTANLNYWDRTEANE